MHTRIAREVRSPVTATALALESRDHGKSIDQALFVSCDLVAIDAAILDEVRKQLKVRLPDFEPSKLVISATHTHTAPVIEEGLYEIPRAGVMQPVEYSAFLTAQLVGRPRKPGSRESRAEWAGGWDMLSSPRTGGQSMPTAGLRCTARPTGPTSGASKAPRIKGSRCCSSGCRGQADGDGRQRRLPVPGS